MKKVIRDPAVLERMKMAYELCDLAETMQRQNNRRRHPELSNAEVEDRLVQWLARSPEEEIGEADLKFFRIRKFAD